MSRDASAARRPLRSRNTAWAGFFSRAMLRMGLTPNLVSVLSMGFAALAGWLIWQAAWRGVPPAGTEGEAGANHGGEAVWVAPVLWLAAAACIQLRLFCNLMDGLLAVEGGLKSATGELFNEIPDRVADALILVPMGYAAGLACPQYGAALGWAAAVGAVFTAYVRAMGAALTGQHDFHGPMAKPHRMAAATLACLGMVVLTLTGVSRPLLPWALGLINAGIAVTLWRRISRLAGRLRQRGLPSPARGTDDFPSDQSTPQ